MDYGITEVVDLLRSLRPFLSQTAILATEMFEHYTSILASEPGQKAVQSLSGLLSKTSGASSEELSDDQVVMGGKKESTNPFELFLILVLLLLSFDGIPCEPEPKQDPLLLPDPAQTEIDN